MHYVTFSSLDEEEEEEEEEEEISAFLVDRTGGLLQYIATSAHREKRGATVRYIAHLYITGGRGEEEERGKTGRPARKSLT